MLSWLYHGVESDESRGISIGRKTYQPGSDWLMAFVPMIMLCGMVILVWGVIWGATVFSVRTVFICGIAMLVLGAYPWFYTGKGEAGGMFGTLLFLSLGIPGLVVTLVGVLIGGWQRGDYE